MTKEQFLKKWVVISAVKDKMLPDLEAVIATEIAKVQEANKIKKNLFSKEDMIDFLKFYKSYILMLQENGWKKVESSEERILEVWKENKHKTIYFKNK